VGLQTDERHRRVSFNRSTILFGQHLGDMFCLYRNAFPVERPLYIHQASHVGGHHRIGPGVQDMSDFVFHHGRGNDRVLYCKTAAEAAAIVGIDHFYKFNAPNLVEKLPGLMLDSQAPEQMAGVVVHHPTASCGPDVFDTQLIHQVLGKFEGPLPHRHCSVAHSRVAPKQLRVVVPDHVHTGTGRADDGAGAGEHLDEMVYGAPRFFTVT